MNKFFNKEIISQDFLEKIYSDSNVYPDKFSIDIPFLGLKLSDIKVVILDEYPCRNNNGLAFSTSEIKLNNTIKNIFLEIKNNTGIENKIGDLTSWKYQGILLLNATPVCNKNFNPTHYESEFKNKTKKIISELSKQCDSIIFVMWGNKIQRYAGLIDKRHTILSSSHPNPHSSNISFMGNNHFSRINEILEKQGKTKINWSTN